MHARTHACIFVLFLLGLSESQQHSELGEEELLLKSRRAQRGNADSESRGYRHHAPVSTEAWQKAEAWAKEPWSTCFEPPDVPAKQIRLSLVTMASGMKQAVRACISMNRLILALKQGLRYCEFHRTMDYARDPKWSKILQAKEVLYFSPRIFVLDADALFARFDVPLLPLLEKLSGGRDALFSTEFGHKEYEMSDKEIERVQHKIDINSGAFFLRSSLWSFDFLNTVYIEATWPMLWGFAAAKGLHDQAGITHFRNQHPEEWKEHVRVVNFRYFNGWRRTFHRNPGGLVYHVAGGKNTRDKYDSFVYPRCIRFNSGNFSSAEAERDGLQRLL